MANQIAVDIANEVTVKDTEIKVMCGDADEFYMDAYDDKDGKRCFVWVIYPVSKNMQREKVVAKFSDWDSADKFAIELNNAFVDLVKNYPNITRVTLI